MTGVQTCALPICCTHPSRDDAWIYHEKVPFILLKNPVPPTQIELVAEFDLEAMMENCIFNNNTEDSSSQMVCGREIEGRVLQKTLVTKL